MEFYGAGESRVGSPGAGHSKLTIQSLDYLGRTEADETEVLPCIRSEYMPRVPSVLYFRVQSDLYVHRASYVATMHLSCWSRTSCHSALGWVADIEGVEKDKPSPCIRLRR